MNIAMERDVRDVVIVTASSCRYGLRPFSLVTIRAVSEIIGDVAKEKDLGDVISVRESSPWYLSSLSS